MGISRVKILPGEYIARIHDEVKRRPNYVVGRIAGRNTNAQRHAREED